MAENIKVSVENVNSPGHITKLDAIKYEAMKKVLLSILPRTKPGLSAKEIREKMAPILPQDLWPNGKKAGWWFKAVQLDLEAKGLMSRDEKAKPLRWWKTS